MGQESHQDLLKSHGAGGTDAAWAVWRWPTYDKGLLGLCPVLVVPGWPACRVDGPLAGPQQGGLRLALAGGPLPGGLGGAHSGIQPVQGLSTAVTGVGRGKSTITGGGEGHTFLLCGSGVLGDPIVQVRDAMEEWDRQAQLRCSTTGTHISVTHGQHGGILTQKQF